MDGHDLERFVRAQAPVFDAALAELRAGTKRSHWMWFVFPQLAGLGRSPTARFYALASLDEARAFLAHPVLGPRLREATETVLSHPDRSLRTIFGTPDDLKFVSSATLFDHASNERANVFVRALETFNEGRRDPRTLELLGAPPQA